MSSMLNQPKSGNQETGTPTKAQLPSKTRKMSVAFTPTTEEEVEKALRSLNTGQYWWNKINSLIIEQVFMSGYHNKQAELRQRLVERFNYVSPIDRLPVLYDPLFSSLKEAQLSESERSQTIRSELQKRLRSYVQQVRTGQLDVFPTIPSLMVPLVLSETSAGKEASHTSTQTTLTNFLLLV